MSEQYAFIPNGERIEPAPVPPKRIRRRRIETPLDVEAKAIGGMYTALEPLKDDSAAMERVIEYVRRRLGFPA